MQDHHAADAGRPMGSATYATMRMDSEPAGSTAASITFEDVGLQARALWAKSGRADGAPSHGLLAHLLDVAAVAEELLLLEPPATRTWIRTAFGVPEERAVRWVASLVGLHDLGKATPGFQSKDPAGRQADEKAGLPFRPGDLLQDRHDLASSAELQPLLAPWVGSAARVSVVSRAVGAHHGHVFDSAEVRQARLVGEPLAWRTARAKLFQVYMAVLATPMSDSSESIPTSALAWLAGLTSIADWIGSNPDWFPPGERSTFVKGHYERARQLAREALAALGWPRYEPLMPTGEPRDVDADGLDVNRLVARMVGVDGIQARPLQRAAARLLANPAGPQLVIVEAPMGEGKTELAFLATLRLQSALGHRGLFVGLPTQATGNAMFARTLQFLRTFGSGQPLDIQLAHGGILKPDTLLRLRDVYGDTGDGVRSSAWFAQRRRPLVSPYGVGTIDQALLATVNAKHHFVRLWGLANRIVVLDEVHAYDTYTGGLIEALLRWLRRLGCSVILMSATLPRERRDALLTAWHGAAVDLPELAYPRVLALDGQSVRGETVSARTQAPIEIAGIGEDVGSIASTAIDAISKGGCGAVVVNTVDRAQHLYRRLRDAFAATDVVVVLFHARLPADDRQARENAVLGQFGREGVRPRSAVVVATQVVEQSLDVDFDWMVTDLAPIDLLLQRAGRLHRHVRSRPTAHSTPRLVVAGLQPQRLPELQSTGWALYDEFVLLRTWAIASRTDRWHLPDDIDRLVQRVYSSDELPPDMPSDMVRRIEVTAFGGHVADTEHEAMLSRYAAIDARAEPTNAWSNRPRGNEEGDFGQRNVTRLGPESVAAVPVHAVSGGWALARAGASFDPNGVPDMALARDIVQRQVRLTRRDVVRGLASVEAPPGWRDHAWLRDLRPIVLVDGRATVGRTEIALDDELGIVYGTAQTTGAST